jgi:hypothetical protein
MVGRFGQGYEADTRSWPQTRRVSSIDGRGLVEREVITSFGYRLMILVRAPQVSERIVGSDLLGVRPCGRRRD